MRPYCISPHCVSKKQGKFDTVCSWTKLRFLRHVLHIGYVDCFDCTHSQAMNIKHAISHIVFEQETRYFLHCVVVQSWDFRDTFCSLVMCEWVPKSCWVLHIDQLLKKGEMRKKKKNFFRLVWKADWFCSLKPDPFINTFCNTNFTIKLLDCSILEIDKYFYYIFNFVIVLF